MTFINDHNSTLAIIDFSKRSFVTCVRFTMTFLTDKSKSSSVLMRKYPLVIQIN